MKRLDALRVAVHSLRNSEASLAEAIVFMVDAGLDVAGATHRLAHHRLELRAVEGELEREMQRALERQKKLEVKP